MSSDLTNFSGQVVLVVGAASGIGRATAHLIASRGGTVVIADLDKAGSLLYGNNIISGAVVPSSNAIGLHS